MVLAKLSYTGFFKHPQFYSHGNNLQLYLHIFQFSWFFLNFSPRVFLVLWTDIQSLEYPTPTPSIFWASHNNMVTFPFNIPDNYISSINSSLSIRITFKISYPLSIFNNIFYTFIRYSIYTVMTSDYIRSLKISIITTALWKFHQLLQKRTIHAYQLLSSPCNITFFPQRKLSFLKSKIFYGEKHTIDM